MGDGDPNIARIAALEANQDALLHRLDGISSKLDALHDDVSKAKGGLRTIIALGSVVAVAGGYIATHLGFTWHAGAN